MKYIVLPDLLRDAVNNLVDAGVLIPSGDCVGCPGIRMCPNPQYRLAEDHEERMAALIAGMSNGSNRSDN